MSRVLQVKRGLKSDLPTLATAEFGFVIDSGAEELYIGTGNKNIKFARQDHVDGKADKSSIIETTLLASDWNDGVYELAVPGVTKTSVQEILASLSITKHQLYTFQLANIQDYGQDTDKIILKAFGDIPEFDIPIRVILRGDM